MGDVRPEEVDPLIGVTVAGRYRVERRLGEGGIGCVYRAIQEPLGRAVALKILHPDLSGRKEMHLRFEREARAASKLAHPGSVMVFDFGTWNGMLYLVMELVDGTSLDDLIQYQSPLEADRAIDLAVQLCDALEAAHALGLLHRDLKPENVLITHAVDGREIAKICDYGLAFLFGEEELYLPRLTREGTVAGTPDFMAPEQVLNKPLDQRTDLYALGCVLYEMLAGQAPFLGESSMEILTKQLYEDPEPPSRISARPIPRELEQIVLWAMQKVPAKRPQSAAELRAALLHARNGSGRPERPTTEEVQVLVDRSARVQAAGISAASTAPARQTPEALEHSDGDVAVVASAGTAFERSAVPVLRAGGVRVHSLSDLNEVGAAQAVVVDVRGDPARWLHALKGYLASRPANARATVVVVGPDDDFVTMTRALELKIAEYVPESLLSSLPRKVHRAVERARKSKG